MIRIVVSLFENTICTENFTPKLNKYSLAHTRTKTIQIQIQFSADGNADQSAALKYVRTNVEDYESIGNVLWRQKKMDSKFLF